jgi:hypothetical protein
MVVLVTHTYRMVRNRYSDRLWAGRSRFNSQLTLESTQPWVPPALYLGVKWQCREADHSPPSSVEVKKGGATPPSPIFLHGIVLN